MTSIAAAAAPPVPWEVLVVDGGRTGSTLLAATELPPRLRIRYVYERADGQSAARRRALREARADLVVFVDDDVTIGAGFLTSYAAAVTAHPDVAFFGGPVEIRFELPPPAWVDVDLRLLASMFGELWVDPDHLAVFPEKVPGAANFAVRRSRTRVERFADAVGKGGLNGEEPLFFKRLLGVGAAGRWLPCAVVHRWIPPEQTTASHLLRRCAASAHAHLRLRVCDDPSVAPPVILGGSPRAAALRVQRAMARLLRRICRPMAERLGGP
jgi:hypothetical protein